MMSPGRAFVCTLLLCAWPSWSWSAALAMPPPGRHPSTSDLIQFISSLRGFVGEVSGMLARPEHHEGLFQLSLTGLGYLDSLNILNNRLILYLNDHEASQILQIQEALRNLVTLLEAAAQYYENLEEDQFNFTAHETMTIVRPVGRQRIPINREQIEILNSIGFSWTQMANVFGVSVRTIRNRRHEFNMPFGNAVFSDLADQEIDELIITILQIAPRLGQSMIIGSIRQRGINLQRHRIRESILRVNPVATALRRRYHIIRRRYNVGQPNALWHVDGNHKLILWRLVVHGGIDGYSRTVVFLQCVNNNRAGTVLDGFMRGVNRFGLPQRLRIDFGTENYDIARYMLEGRGLGRGSVIAGRSVHNQRIERLWRDVNAAVLSTFRDTFFYMEEIGLLHRDSEIHLYALHFVFIPRINRALQHFLEMWNSHILRTAGRSPLQLFYTGILAHNVYIDQGNLEMYGVDEGGRPGEMQTINNVHVPPLNFNISEADINYLQTNVDVLENDNNNGINIFINVLDVLNRQQ